MGIAGQYLVLVAVGILGSCILGLQRPPPRYSQQYMPETSFNCRNKIVGSYYADPETDCQVFHVCVSVAGSIQDFKFLCPNDTAFDQESQTCADWYDVDCEAATLYYASDNFDLYRIGSGLESVHYDSIRNDVEPQDHLQRSETSDPVRSSSNKVAATSYNSNNNNNNNNNNNRDILRGSSSGNFYNNRNGKQEDYESEKTYTEPEVSNRKKNGVRKVSRKQVYNPNGNVQAPSTTIAPSTSNTQYNYDNSFYNNNNNYKSNNNNNNNRNQNTQRYSTPTTTFRPSTNYQNVYSSYSTTGRTTVYSGNANYNTYNANQQTSNGFGQSTTAKPVNYNAKNYYDHQTYSQSTTAQPSTNYQSNDYTNYQKTYSNHQRGNVGSYQSTSAPTTVYDGSYNSYNNGQYRNGVSTAKQEPTAQTTAKYFASYAPTTYSPATKKYANGDSAPAQTRNSNDRYNGPAQLADNGPYYDKTAKPAAAGGQFHESAKLAKKATQYSNVYDAAVTAKYYAETSTSNYDYVRSSAAIGFSPSSINHLAESPRPTTPAPRRAASATTYNPSSFNSNTQRPVAQSTTPRGTSYVSGSARPFSTTTTTTTTATRLAGGEPTTARPKTAKKNDYDYAYYDNAGNLEYDGLDLEHVAGNKESSKIARN